MNCRGTSMLKRIISLSLIIVMMVSLAGCKLPKATSIDTQTNTNNTESVTAKQAEKERVIEEAKAYLQENYPDDVFTYVSGRSPNWAYRYYELGFSSEKYDGQTVIVYGDPRKDDNPNSVVTSYYKDDLGRVIYDYFDNYYQYPAKQELETYCLDIAQEYVTKDISIESVIGTDFGYALEFDSTKDFIENLANDTLSFRVVFTVDCNHGEIDDSIQCILERFVESNIYLSDVSFIYNDIRPNGHHVNDHYTTRYGEIKEK